MAEGTFSDRLKAALQAKHWKQADLVRETGLDKNTISALVNDKARPNPATVGRIEAALGVTLDTLAGSGEDRPAVAADDLGEAELIEALSYRLGKLRRERDEALAELERLRRMQGGQSDAGQAEAQKNPDDDGGAGATVTPIRPDNGALAARKPKLGTPSKHQHDPMAHAGEESQDNGTDDPA